MRVPGTPIAYARWMCPRFAKCARGQIPVEQRVALTQRGHRPPDPFRRSTMFFHHRELAYTVRVDKPNPVFARMLQQAIGGPEGEMRVMNQYLFQGFGHRGEKKYRDMLLATGTEEIGHVEVLATAVAMNLEGAKSEQVDEVITNPAVAARMGALEPRHFLSGGLGAMPSDANGVPF